MFNTSPKITVSFRIEPELWKRFTLIVYRDVGSRYLAATLENMIKGYVEKLDDKLELNDPRRVAPSIMSDLNTEIIPFLRTLDLDIISAPENKEGMLHGPLEVALNNCRDASIYARALRVRRVMGTSSFETQRQTRMTYDEAYQMIKRENMEEHMNRKLYEIHFESLRQNKGINIEK